MGWEVILGTSATPGSFGISTDIDRERKNYEFIYGLRAWVWLTHRIASGKTKRVAQEFH
ncbi:hypothetical protein GHT06_014861 [Daphnia sinensis]|uniref:Uncharacterized protein n=1 Tax=Daphnia sinensis TaxID=1820382 RepID=A0AAD5LI26_9CRUS|nr:hypothetical protein GHT06_014861 [Daphnia sinensis]